MKALLQWIDQQGGLFSVLFELGLGLFVVVCLVRCAL